MFCSLSLDALFLPALEYIDQVSAPFDTDSQREKKNGKTWRGAKGPLSRFGVFEPVSAKRKVLLGPLYLPCVHTGHKACVSWEQSCWLNACPLSLPHLIGYREKEKAKIAANETCSEGLPVATSPTGFHFKPTISAKRINITSLL